MMADDANGRRKYATAASFEAAIKYVLKLMGFGFMNAVVAFVKLAMIRIMLRRLTRAKSC